VHPEDLPLIEEEVHRCMQECKPLEMRYRIIWPDGSLHWVETKGVFLHDSDGNSDRMLGVVMDITARKRAEEQIKASLAEKEVMLREIHHRVKNNLQVISSLISLQADNLTDERMREEFNDVRDRVRSMALIHEQLYQTSDLARLNFADYAVSLLHSLWRSHGALAEKVQLNLALASVTLSIKTAMPCGLILNELAGNALKHAFPGSNGGEVTVGLEHDSVTGAVCLHVHDNGVGLPAGLDWRQSPSLGLHLVQILAGQLCGTVETGIGPGAEFSVTFPLNGC
jgi:two-component sensor histidine kinase